MNTRGVAIAVLMVAALGACGDDDTPTGGGFSATTRSRYMEGCTSSQTEEFCACTLNELEERFTEEEFMRFAIEATEEPPQDLIEVSIVCISEADLDS
ncbi:MAG: hypothetical protein HZA58_03395 [Acidimicrobiia bacterium]|nr:hypothetical protein [Acidimicrobiia bacterium]